MLEKAIATVLDEGLRTADIAAAGKNAVGTTRDGRRRSSRKCRPSRAETACEP